jgi:acetyl-CoA acetyltransferase
VAAGQECIVGIGQTAYRKRGQHVGETEVSLACAAIRSAAADAGLPIAAIDGLAAFGNDMSGERAYAAALIQQGLGLPMLRHSSFVWTPGGGGACAAVAQAADAVRSGRATYVAVVRALRQVEGERYGQFNPERPFFNFTAPFGAFAPAPLYALQMQRHMHLYGTRADQLGEVAVAFRAHANRNPRAVMHERHLTLEDYSAAPWIAEPYRRFDCCLETDGAAALIVTSAERARDLTQRPVRILSARQGAGGDWGAGPLGSHNMPDDTYATGNVGTLSEELFAQAGLTPADVDVAQIYDAFTGMVIMTLEDYGFCARGEGGAFVDGGRLRWPAGDLPTNTAGGHLSEAYIHGMNLAVEAVRQIRGTSTAQVEGAEVAFVASAAGIAPTSAMVLAR